MTSEVGICNLALSHLGDAATVASITPPDGSAQAEHCELFYPIARDTLLEMHAWKFATRRIQLSALTVPSWSWAYAYSEPSECVKLLAVLPLTAASDDETQPYEPESSSAGAGIILTDQQQATCRFIARVTDPMRFSPLFTDALTWLLASYLAGPVLKGDAGITAARTCYQTFRTQFGIASASDANQRKSDPRANEKRATWIAGR